jgi:DNA-binding transcriptional LysR family regulator
MQTLDLAVLRTLIAAVEGGSFAAAARKVGRSESAVSLQLRGLER